MSYKVEFKIKSQPLQTAIFKEKTGKFGAVNFKKHLKEVYGNNVRIKITKK